MTWTTEPPFTVPHFTGWASGLVLNSGEPWIVEDFQAEFAGDFFTGEFMEHWLVIPEGNAKTTLTMGLALYHCRFRRWAKVAVAAASRDQAKQDWDAGQGFVIRSESAMEGFTAHPGLRRIRYRAPDARPGDESEIQIWAAAARTGDGIDPTLTIIDELHRHRDLELYRTWRGKLRKSGGKMIAISTAGEPGSEFEAMRDTIRQGDPNAIRAGTYTRAVGPGIVLHEYAVPEDGDTDDLELVNRANPLKQITPETLAEVRYGPLQSVQHWRRFNCNLPTRSESAAIAESEWFGAQVADVIPEKEPVWAGLDVAWKWDTTALVPLWIREPEYRLLGPADVLVPPRDGTSLEPSLVEDALHRLHERNPIHTVVMDETRAEQLAVWIADELGARVVPWPHSPKMAALDYERFMEALREGWLHHPGDPKLTRHVLNAVAKVRAEGTRFDRPSQTREGGNQDMRVIDALIAAAMVHNAAAAEIGVEREPMIAWV